jgi:hypothetical protein
MKKRERIGVAAILATCLATALVLPDTRPVRPTSRRLPGDNLNDRLDERFQQFRGPDARREPPGGGVPFDGAIAPTKP